MVHVVKKLPPITAALEQPPPPGAVAVLDSLTRTEVEAMLAARDASWAQQLAALAQAFTLALAARPEPPPRKGASITFRTDLRGTITGADIIPKV